MPNDLPATHSNTHNTGGAWFGSLVVRALDSRLNGRELDSQLHRLALGWVTVFAFGQTALVFHQAT